MFLLGTCFSPWAGNKLGTISINFGGNARVAGMPVWPPVDNDGNINPDLEHRIELQGPTGTQIHTLEKGAASAEFTVVTGLWNVTVDAYFEDNHYATGSGSVNVIAGRTSPVLIDMRQIIWHTITFIVDSVEYDKTYVISGKTISNRPADPTKAGYIFGGWFRESGLVNQWNFSTETVTEDITLYAKLVSTGTITINLGESTG